MTSFDEILEQKLGLGQYQYFLFASIFMTDISAGISLQIGNLLFPLFQKQFSLSDAQNDNVIISHTLGAIIPLVILALFNAKLGRKSVMVYGNLLFSITSVMCYFVSEYYSLVIFIFLLRIFSFFSSIYSQAILIEIWTQQMRGQIVTIQLTSMALGQILIVVVGITFLTSLSTGNWRALYYFQGIVSFLAFLMTFFFTYQSPRFLLQQEKFQQAFQIIDKIGIRNIGKQQYILLSDGEKDGLKLSIYQISRNFTNQAHNKAKIGDFFQKPQVEIFFKFTLYVYFTSNTMLGIKLISPRLFQKYNQSIYDLLWQNIGQLFYLPMTVPFVEWKLFGRQGTALLNMYLSCLFNIIGGSLIYNGHIDAFSWIAVVITIFNKASNAMFYVLSSEAFPTKYRTLSFPICNFVIIIMSIPLPYAYTALFNINNSFPVFMFSIMIFLGSIPLKFITQTQQFSLDTAKRSFCEEENDTNNQDSIFLSLNLGNNLNNTNQISMQENKQAG